MDILAKKGFDKLFFAKMYVKKYILKNIHTGS